MPVITNTLLDGTGDPLSGCFVTARLKPTGAFVTASFEEIVPVVSTVTSSAGVWTLDLYQNSLLTPSGSYWEIEERIPKGNGQTRLWTIEVGAINQSLYASLVDPLDAANTLNYITQASGDARYVQSPGSFGTVLLGPASASSAGTEATYARTDHRHPANLSGTAAERAALTGLDLYEGKRFRETDSTDKLYDYRAAAWLQVRESFVVADATARNAITTPYEGMEVYQVDTDISYVYTGSAWVISHTHGQWISHTLTFNQSNTGLTGTLNYCRYKKEGRTVTISWQKSFATGTLGVANNAVLIPNSALPFDTAYTTAQILGVGQAYGALAGIQYNLGIVLLGTTAAGGTTVRFIRSDTTVANYWGIDPNAAIANGDALAGTITYEALT
jgi:hypothetical protein